jgi:uracil-DNA glycosylase
LLAGLAPGQKVVASGQFLIDSEASLSGIEARPIGGREHDERSLAGADHRFARHQQGGSGIAPERHAREHAGGQTEVLAGLAPGQKVVASGQFLIDSEASLSGSGPRRDGSARRQPRA